MTPRQRQTLAGAGLIGSITLLTGLALLLAGGGGGGSEGNARSASLLELLEQVARPEADPERQPAPDPPPHPPWRSPLRRQCEGIDPGLRQRLSRGREQLPERAQRVLIDPTNYGRRHRLDAYGNPLDPTPRVVVLHETVFSMESAINTFLTTHPRDEDQVSYHTVIGDDGTIVVLVDPARRAFGAGNSAFQGEWAITNAGLRGSVNNFALHVSLETPRDGADDGLGHSGYTPSQYDALALVLDDWMERYGLTPFAVTSHAAVDLGGERSDPRSFDWSALQARLAALDRLCPT
ncbi:N-acetylmuramoyl-L-alanine amidase [Synechococcus sp. RSCCF101]|uniref:N-acetylmuramoyl-L-alanine amidase n=1 Tax=Synechococcus sp. RSCCF101 TaxID=2511069 RepID=UPI0012483F0B|nr:peptidoglycan recognition family protein [Synechococcus sp. RSCCF101]QEY31710.1 N-acetylmuramoyl-L-alanine amidase [Synechococcus sp. RSCCF101]